VLSGDLLAGEVDTAFTLLPLDPERIAWAELALDRRVLGVSQGNPLYGAEVARWPTC
jgi:DNA-binding transcriptional LysR family regulator